MGLANHISDTAFVNVKTQAKITHLIHNVKISMEFRQILLDFSLSVKAATLIFISGCGWAISSAMEGKSGCIYKLVKS